jgi:hypothetical protein
MGSSQIATRFRTEGTNAAQGRNRTRMSEFEIHPPEADKNSKHECSNIPKRKMAHGFGYSNLDDWDLFRISKFAANRREVAG